LHAGLGRALRDVRTVPERERREILLDACMHNRSYDPQLDSDRAAWLCEILVEAGDLSEAAKHLLSPIPEDTEDWDHVQRVHLARELTRFGYQAAGAFVGREFRAHIQDPSDFIAISIASDLMTLNGSDGLVEVSKGFGSRVGEHAPVDDLRHTCGMLAEEAAEILGGTVAEKVLREAAFVDSAAARFLELAGIARGSDGSPASDPRRELWGTFTFEDLRARAEGSIPDDQGPSIWTWAKSIASDADLEKVLSAVATETDRRLLTTWVLVFALRRMPRFEPRFLELLDATDHGTSWNAGRALEQVEHPELRRRAIDQLRAGRCDVKTMQLLRSNFRMEDVPILERALPTQGDLDEYHAVARGICDIAKTRGPAGLRDLLEWAYENSGCSHCRNEAVRKLVEAGDARASILEECRFDSSPELREFARTTLAGSPGPAST
jgi:hypothetical protein